MSVMAKFGVKSIQHIATGNPADVCAEINPDAIAGFDLGKDYFIEFAAAD